MLWLLLGVVIAVLLAMVVIAIVANKKKTEYRKMYTAAGNILREDYLNYALQNHAVNDSLKQPQGRKKMICLKTNRNKKKISFVFDPEKSIYIGRDADASNVFIDNVSVSLKNCRIYAENNQIMLEDLYSTNGTVVRRGSFKRYMLRDGYRIALHSGDVICVGNSELKLLIFDYNIAVM